MVAPIQSLAEVFAPLVFLEIDGKDATDLREDLITFDFIDHEKKMDELTFVLNNKELVHQDDFRLVRGVRLKVRWGYASDMSDSRQMIVTKVDNVFPQSGVPTTTVTAFDIRRTLNKKGNPKNWGVISSSEIAGKIARRYGLKSKLQDSGDSRKEARVQPADTTDMQYLLALATKLHWDCYVEGSVLHFHPKRYDDAPLYEFDYFVNSLGTLLDFRSSLNLKKYPNTGKSGTSPTTGGVTSESADGGNTGEEHAADHWVDIDAKTGAIFGSLQSFQPGDPARETEVGGPLLSCSSETSPNVIKKHAKARQAKIEAYAVKATASMVGTPKLRSRQMVKIGGVGQTYSGIWRIEEARHRLVGRGSTIYKMSCKLKRNAIKLGTKDTRVRGNDKGAGVRQAENDLVVIDTLTGGIEDFSS